MYLNSKIIRSVTCGEQKSIHILDLFCGRGGGLSYLNDNYEIKSGVGIDVSPKAINYANKRFRKQGLKFIRSEVEDIEHIQELRNHREGFNVITCLEGIRYIEDKDEFLRTLCRFMSAQREKGCGPEPTLIIADHFHVSDIEKF